ncbi:MAG: sulfotransferase [Acidimicrobiia bacterium]|nr:sulfotransferase [Acidimicrobiia bacterium]MDH3398606.1 sulfotransferase [Acidimicrobiia bacterium]
MPPDHLFITGCYRSGTTLMEKLLHQHRQVSVASQPAPVLYFLAKERFLARRGLVRRYPIDSLVGETQYTVDDFTNYLEGLTLTDSDLDELFSRLADYRMGQWTPEILEHRRSLHPGPFVDVQKQIHALAAARLGQGGSALIGGKEILCEEFVPHFLAHGHRAIIIVRDPRDVIASLDYATRDNLTGNHRPTLYSLRLWRKSVAFSIALSQEPRFISVRFEDLVRQTQSVVNRVTDFLGLEHFPFNEVERLGIRTQSGDQWRGNSSFEDSNVISTSAVGRFVDVLPRLVVEYVEALTRTEMLLLGYKPVTDRPLNDQLLASFQESAAVHERFESDYATHPEQVQQEIRRLEMLEQITPAAPTEARAMFIFEQAYEQLRAAVRL